MRLFLISISSVLLSLSAQGQQNLVPNGGFEEFQTCPSSTGQWSLVEHWTSPNQKSSDYFHSCASTTATHSVNAPNNKWGWQQPYEGMGYMGIASFSVPIPNIREYVQTEMIDTLTSGIRYHVGFRTSAADRFQYAIGTLGAALTANLPPVVSTWHPDGMLDAEPQVLQNGRLPLMDTANWVLISDTVLAQGGELYLTIGNFHLDGESDTVRFNPDQPPIYNMQTTHAYYYIDDVFVYAIDSVPNSITELEEEDNVFSIYPNPTTGLLTIEYDLGEEESGHVEMFDLSGRKVFGSVLRPGNSTTQIRLEDLQSGLYLFRIAVNGSTEFSERISVIK